MSDDTGDVVPLRPKAPATEAATTEGLEPHWEGEAECGACHHKWWAVVPVGDEDHLECPNCKRYWGAARHAVLPPKWIWKCNCGEALYWLTPEGALCRRCGSYNEDWA